MDPCQSASQIEEIKPLLRGDKLTMNNPLWKIWNFHHTISILIKFLNNSKEDIYLSWITSKLAPARPFLKRNKPPVISFIQAAAPNLATIKFAQAHLHGKQNHSTTESRYQPPNRPGPTAAPPPGSPSHTPEHTPHQNSCKHPSSRAFSHSHEIRPYPADLPKRKLTSGLLLTQAAIHSSSKSIAMVPYRKI